MSRATSLVSVAQQLAISAGVAFGALAVELTVRFRGGGALSAHDFPPAFLAVAAISVTVGAVLRAAFAACRRRNVQPHAFARPTAEETSGVSACARAFE